jgi:hypothetical protein
MLPLSTVSVPRIAMRQEAAVRQDTFGHHQCHGLVDHSRCRKAPKDLLFLPPGAREWRTGSLASERTQTLPKNGEIRRKKI